MAKLTQKQRIFADEYTIDSNATAAAIRAGYSEKTAYSIGQENLKKPEIEKYIAERRKAASKKLEISQERIINELASIAFDKTTDFAIMGVPIVNGATHKTANKIKALESISRMLGFDQSEKSKPETNLLDAIVGAAEEDIDTDEIPELD